MFKKFSILKTFGGSHLIRFSSRMRFASEAKPEFTLQDLSEHRWLDYDPTHKVFF